MDYAFKYWEQDLAEKESDYKYTAEVSIFYSRNTVDSA